MHKLQENYQRFFKGGKVPLLECDECGDELHESEETLLHKSPDMDKLEVSLAKALGRPEEDVYYGSFASSGDDAESFYINVYGASDFDNTDRKKAQVAVDYVNGKSEDYIFQLVDMEGPEREPDRYYPARVIFSYTKK